MKLTRGLVVVSLISACVPLAVACGSASDSSLFSPARAMQKPAQAPRVALKTARPARAMPRQGTPTAGLRARLTPVRPALLPAARTTAKAVLVRGALHEQAPAALTRAELRRAAHQRRVQAAHQRQARAVLRAPAWAAPRWRVRAARRRPEATSEAQPAALPHPARVSRPRMAPCVE
jgi:hypothetical protein